MFGSFVVLAVIVAIVIICNIPRKDKTNTNAPKQDNNPNLEHRDCVEEPAQECIHMYGEDNRDVKTCTNCGHKNEKKAKHCTVCGTKLK